MGYDKNIVSSCSAIADFNIDTFLSTKERLRTLQQLEPFQYGFINNSLNKIQEINYAMGGLCTGDVYVLAHYMPDLMRHRASHRASLEATLTSIVRFHTCGCHYSNNIPSPLWRGSVVSMAITERDCQYLHAIIDEGNPTNAAMILSKVKDYLHDLMMHRFGSTLIKKIFEAKKGMAMEQMDSIVYLILANDRKMWDVCINYYGTRVMQTILHNTRHPFMKFVVAYAVKRNTTALMKNTNGSHVIVQCVKLFPSILKKMILDEVARNCCNIATDKIGCLAVKRCLKHGEGTAIDLLVTQIISNAMYVIKMKFPLAKEWMIEEFQNKFDRLSMNKYASNVMEYLLRFSNKSAVKVIVEEIMRSRNFLKVLQDPFGNYVA
ncbi:putative pumilio domain-containing protein [Medicago truncatula]|uniref:Putative pumilio domain-containing protein n=1 Tax=Medicago truncatula TaxID=3880 RepID=A0A396J402_MEDTR|nr:putative pumilio domain-containing protein [Medicago truncatula]